METLHAASINLIRRIGAVYREELVLSVERELKVGRLVWIAEVELLSWVACEISISTGINEHGVVNAKVLDTDLESAFRNMEGVILLCGKRAWHAVRILSSKLEVEWLFIKEVHA